MRGETRAAGKMKKSAKKKSSPSDCEKTGVRAKERGTGRARGEVASDEAVIKTRLKRTRVIKSGDTERV